MFNVADLFVIVIIGLTTFIGYKRGFVKTAFGMASFAIAVILAVTLYKGVAAKLAENTGIDEWIYEKIAGKVDETVDKKEDEESGESLKGTFENLPEKIKEELGLEETKAQAKNMIAEKATSIALNLISFVGIYVVSRIILAIACFVIDLVMKMPVLKQANEILGLVLGAVQGLLSVFIVLAIVMSLTSLINMEWLLAYIKSSLITKVLYENNFVMWLLF